MRLVAVIDACALYPAPLRDLLMRLAVLNVFQPKWTDEIHHEWMRNVLKSRPDLTEAQLNRTKDLMNLHAGDALITGYEPLLASLALPDANDRHVLAAAIHAQASVICTFNLRDFPASALAPYGIEALAPDNFLASLYDADAATFFQAAERQRRGLRNPPKSQAEFWAALEAQRLPQIVQRLRQHPAAEGAEL